MKWSKLLLLFSLPFLLIIVFKFIMALLSHIIINPIAYSIAEFIVVIPLIILMFKIAIKLDEDREKSPNKGEIDNDTI